MIEKINDIYTEKFKKEILYNGNVYFFDGEKINFIKCFNKKLITPNNYKCFQVDGKKEKYLFD